MATPLSILDLAPIAPGQSAGESFAASVLLAQAAERSGHRRVWYAEHHNMSSIASSATSVLVAHVAAHTQTIRLGAGGVMLPNHSPLVIAEQFGTLAELHPGRIDLGLGRAPGSDSTTMRALRRDHTSSDRFPQDVLELQGYLRGVSRIPGVEAVPGRGTDVPLSILGSSLFGAQLAAQLGLPYAFASHFAPDLLGEAVELYRRDFQPSEQLAEPYALVGVNVVTAPDADEAEALWTDARRARTRSMLGRTPAGRAAVERFTDADLDEFLQTPQGQGIAGMMRCTAVGAPEEVHDRLEAFAAAAQADELICAHAPREVDARVRSVELTGATQAALA